jgi:sugar/nucleoside kinase (ribokinase family)
LAVVAAYPAPDAKVRTQSLTTQGGGNAANAATGASRLGATVALCSRVGADGAAAAIEGELARDGVDTRYLLRAEAESEGAPPPPSPSTYIIIDASAATRTCIHTPGPPLTPATLLALPPAASPIAGVATVGAAFFDGRLADAALPVARAAVDAGVPVLVEAERARDGLDDLLATATGVATSAGYPG